MKKVTVVDIQRMKQEKKKIVTMTAYDFSMARIIDKAGVDIILIGDSGGRYLLGHEDNNSVTMDEMVLMARSVSRGAQQALVVADMPFMSYQVSREDALRNAGRLIQEAGAQAVKLEVGAAYAPTVEAVVQAGMPVMAHMGRTPMTTIGSDYRVATSINEAEVMRDAEALEAAGAFVLLLTGITAELAERITAQAKIPTIAGFGAGDRCDGQIGVTHGVVGFTLEELERPRAAYGPVVLSLYEAAAQFSADVRAGKPVRSRQDRKVKEST
jgi:3-methyl-2-oxobutanoate hydroxymethyltransferase